MSLQYKIEPLDKKHDRLSFDCGEESLNIFLKRFARQSIEQAAVASGVSITDFTIRNLSESADEILQQQHFRKLSNRDRDIFLAMLDADDEPNEKLIEAFKARRELIAE